MKFEYALKAMREGKKVVNKFGLHTDYMEVLYIDDEDLISNRYEEGYLVDKDIPVTLSSIDIMSEDWEVIEK